MRSRKIHKAMLTPNDFYIECPSIVSDSILLFGSTVDNIRIAFGNKFSFALRPFSGATRFVFVKDNAELDYVYLDDTLTLRLCCGKVWRYLGIGKRTKQFSIWVKKG